MDSCAAYSPIKPIHSNYPFFAYQNSQVDQFSITGDFTVENALEGQYWLAAVHYLRSVSKMAYGNTPQSVVVSGPGIKWIRRLCIPKCSQL